MKSAGKLPCVVLAGGIAEDQVDKTRIEHVPLAYGWRRMGHFTQSPQLGSSQSPETGNIPVVKLGEIHGVSGQVRQADLPLTAVHDDDIVLGQHHHGTLTVKVLTRKPIYLDIVGSLVIYRIENMRSNVKRFLCSFCFPKK